MDVERQRADVRRRRRRLRRAASIRAPASAASRRCSPPARCSSAAATSRRRRARWTTRRAGSWARARTPRFEALDTCRSAAADPARVSRGRLLHPGHANSRRRARSASSPTRARSAIARSPRTAMPMRCRSRCRSAGQEFLVDPGTFAYHTRGAVARITSAAPPRTTRCASTAWTSPSRAATSCGCARPRARVLALVERRRDRRLRRLARRLPRPGRPRHAPPPHRARQGRARDLDRGHAARWKASTTSSSSSIATRPARSSASRGRRPAPRRARHHAALSSVPGAEVHVLEASTQPIGGWVSRRLRPQVARAHDPVVARSSPAARC